MEAAVRMNGETYDFSGIQWIGMRTGECPSAEAGYDGRVFAEAQRNAAARGIPKNNNVYFRRMFTIDSMVERAMLRTVGLGYYELYINSRRVGDTCLTPCNMDFNKKVLYNVYDVTEYLHPGKNVIAYEIGGGWFAPDAKFSDWRFFFYGNIRLIMSMDILMYNGSNVHIQSDEAFRFHDASTIAASIYDGQKEDGRLRIPGWNTESFDDSDWEKAVFVEAPAGKLSENLAPPIREIGCAAPLRSFEIVENMRGYAFAENLIGWLRVRVEGPRGASIMLNHSENINPDGTLNAMTNRKAFNEDVYILRGEGIETFEPRFIWHNFQYAAITLSDPSIRVISVEQINVRSDVKRIGKFTCSEPILNELHEKFLRSQEDCLMGNPIDCPQRDERLGWLGDAYITSDTCLYNLDMRTFYENFMWDIHHTQDENGDIALIAPRPFSEPSFDWTAGYIILAEAIMRAYGDNDVLYKHYDSMQKFRRRIRESGTNYEIPRARCGDWMSTLPDFVRGDPDCLTTMLFIWCTEAMCMMAKRIGREEDLSEMQHDIEEAKKVIDEKYYDHAEKHFITDTQCANALGLLLKLCPEEDCSVVLDHLVEDIHAHKGCLTTGILGTKYVLEVLERYNRQDEIYNLLMNEEFPGWRNLLNGHSTLPEKWTGGGSGCHAMFDTADSYFYTSFAGIRIDETKDDAITFHPWISPKLEYVSASLDTVEGTVASRWMRSGDDYIITVSVPNGKTAVFEVDKGYGERIICVNGRRTLERRFKLFGGENTIYVTDDPKYVRYNRE